MVRHTREQKSRAGRQLARIRSALDLSQEDLAAGIGRSQTWIWQCESGRKALTAANRERAARFLAGRVVRAIINPKR